MPSAFDTVDYGSEINENEVNICEQELETMQHSPCSKLIEDLCVCIMDENNVAMPQDPEPSELQQRNQSLFIISTYTILQAQHNDCSHKLFLISSLRKIYKFRMLFGSWGIAVYVDMIHKL
jgi:hypothetical protein